MDPTKRIIVNTAAQYTKAIINIGLSLYSTRLILDALSISDFGIYAVVGGVVAMLGFITNALVITTQRYISFYHGRGDTSFVAKVFTNSLLLHIVIGIGIAIVLAALKSWLFSDVLNIPTLRIETAQNVYYITILILLTSIIAAPFKALFISRENIVYISVVEIFDGVLKFLFAISLSYVSADRLLVYAFMMLAIQMLNLLAFSVYAKLRYDECRLSIKRNSVSMNIIRQLVGFAGWTTYGAGALAARNQGTAVIVNHFVGTVANAAYGIAFQVNMAIFFVSSSIINAMNPQIMKAEGEGNRARVLKLAGQESKYSAILLSIVTIPILMELPSILPCWLKEVPEHSIMFCTFTLVTCLIDQLTIGLNAVNQAQGKIGIYSMLVFTPKLLCLPIGWWLLYTGYPLESVMWTILIVEAVVAAIRLPYLRATAGLDISDYLLHTILPLLPVIGIQVLFCWGWIQLADFPFRFVLTVILSVLVGIATVWKLALNNDERQYILKQIRSIRKK